MQLEAYRNNQLPDGDFLIVARTSDDLNIPPAEHRPLLMKQSVVRKSYEKHGIPCDELSNLPKWLERHVLAVDSAAFANAVCYLTERAAKPGPMLLIALHMDLAKHTIQIDEVSSIHGRPKLSEFITSSAENRKRFYVNVRTANWLEACRNNLDEWAVEVIEAALNSQNPEESREKCWQVTEQMNHELAKNISAYVKQLNAFVIGRIAGNDSVEAPFGTYDKSVKKIKKLAPFAGKDGDEALAKLEEIEKKWAAAGNLGTTGKLRTESKEAKKGPKKHQDG